MFRSKSFLHGISQMLVVMLSLLLISISLTGCSKTERKAEGNLFELDQIDLIGKSYAIIFSANIWREADLKNGRNVLLLLDDQGDWEAYTTYNLDRANVNWTKDGLYLSDYKYEYFINNEGKIKKSKKTTELRDGTAQDGSFVDDFGGVWSWFDIGFSEEGYETRLTYQYKDKRKETIIEGLYSTLFTSGDKLYGISSSMNLPNGINHFGAWGLVEFIGNDLTPTVIATHPLPVNDLQPIHTSSPVFVNEGSIYAIGEAEIINNEFQTDLIKWNIQSKILELGSIAIPTDSDSGELDIHTYYTDHHAFNNPELYWFNERVELMKTDVQTYETELIQTYDVDVQSNMFHIIKFIGDQVYIIVNDTAWGNSFNQDGAKIKLIQTNLDSPEIFTTIDIKKGNKLAEMLSKDSLTLTGNSFTIRPQSTK